MQPWLTRGWIPLHNWSPWRWRTNLNTEYCPVQSRWLQMQITWTPYIIPLRHKAAAAGIATWCWMPVEHYLGEVDQNLNNQSQETLLVKLSTPNNMWKHFESQSVVPIPAQTTPDLFQLCSFWHIATLLSAVPVLLGLCCKHRIAGKIAPCRALYIPYSPFKSVFIIIG